VAADDVLAKREFDFLPFMLDVQKKGKLGHSPALPADAKTPAGQQFADSPRLWPKDLRM
jgi:hypothetical protein